MSLFDNSFLPIKNQIDRYAKKALNFFEKTNNRTAYNTVKSLLDSLDNLRYNITIVGSFNRGKSTLLNTLMERADDYISPIDYKACTSAIIKYLDKNLLENNPKEIAKIYFNDGKSPIEVSFDEIKDYVVEKNNPNNIKNVKTVEVYGDFPQWSKAVTIIDSPGQNTTFSHHDTLLREHLPNTDAIIFLVASDLPLDGGDVRLLEALDKTQKNKIFFVLTKIDELLEDNPDDYKMVLDYVNKTVNEKVKNVSNKQVYPISAKTVFEAFKSKKPIEIIDKLKQENGIRKLEADLESFIIKESDISQVFINRCRELVTTIEEYVNRYYNSMSRLLDDKEASYRIENSKKQDIEKENKRLKEELEKSLKNFERKYDKTIGDFELKAKNKLANVNDEIVSKIKSDSFVNSIYKAFDLQKEVEKIFYSNYDSDIKLLNTDLNSIQTELTNEFEKQIRIYNERLCSGQDSESAKSGRNALAIYGTTVVGSSAASAIAVGATVYNCVQLSNAGVLSQIWFWLGGKGSVIAATKLAAFGWGLGAIAAVGVTAGVAWYGKDLCDKALKKQQADRVPDLTKECLEKMLENINKTLNDYKNSFVKEYSQYIEDLVDDNIHRIKEIETILSGDNYSKIELIKQQVKEAQELIDITPSLQKLLQ